MFRVGGATSLKETKRGLKGDKMRARNRNSRRGDTNLDKVVPRMRMMEAWKESNEGESRKG